MKTLTDEQLLEEINECADVFIRSCSDEWIIQETYGFSFEELQSLLFSFGCGLLEQCEFFTPKKPEIQE